MFATPFILTALSLVQGTFAASAADWRGRSIYQIITDRFALPAGVDGSKCNPGDQTWCGGTWSAITANLDYIQNAGFHCDLDLPCVTEL